MRIEMEGGGTERPPFCEEDERLNKGNAETSQKSCTSDH